MEYEAVFDLAETGYQMWHWPLFGLVFVGIGVLMRLFPGAFGEWSLSGPPSPLFTKYWLVCAVLWTVLSFGLTFVGCLGLKNALFDGRYHVTEGPVTGYQTSNDLGIKTESFSVQGVRFHYNSMAMSPGFHQVRSKDGPIGEGVNFRIAYVDNRIIRLEVRLP